MNIQSYLDVLKSEVHKAGSVGKSESHFALMSLYREHGQYEVNMELDSHWFDVQIGKTTDYKQLQDSLDHCYCEVCHDDTSWMREKEIEYESDVSFGLYACNDCGLICKLQPDDTLESQWVDGPNPRYPKVAK